MQRGFSFDKSQLKTVCSTISGRKVHIINHLVLLIIQFNVLDVIKVQKIESIPNQWIVFIPWPLLFLYFVVLLSVCIFENNFQTPIQDMSATGAFVGPNK